MKEGCNVVYVCDNYLGSWHWSQHWSWSRWRVSQLAPAAGAGTISDRWSVILTAIERYLFNHKTSLLIVLGSELCLLVWLYNKNDWIYSC